MKPQTGILLVNLGTPRSPSNRDVKRYLTEFLTDGRVIDLPWLYRQLLVRGIIIPRRYKISAEAYREIWMEEGSPLLVHSRRVQQLLQKELGEHYLVELGMRYQEPSLKSALERLLEAGVDQLIIIPQFPQYASATSGSIQQRVMELLSLHTPIPRLVIVDHYFNHPKMIAAFAALGQQNALDEYDHFLFSFHGLPERQLKRACRSGHCLSKPNCCKHISELNRSCYGAQCYATAKSIALALKLAPEDYSISFQSRLGKSPWLQPYTSEVIASCAAQGMRKLLLFSPAFVCDCLETTYELGIEYAAEFKTAGGELLKVVEGLNEHPLWIETLVDLVRKAERSESSETVQESILLANR